MTFNQGLDLKCARGSLSSENSDVVFDYEMADGTVESTEISSFNAKEPKNVFDQKLFLYPPRSPVSSPAVYSPSICITQLIGEGANGSVFAALDDLGNPFAIKTDLSESKRLKKEMKTIPKSPLSTYSLDSFSERDDRPHGVYQAYSSHTTPETLGSSPECSDETRIGSQNSFSNLNEPKHSSGNIKSPVNAQGWPLGNLKLVPSFINRRRTISSIEDEGLGVLKPDARKLTNPKINCSPDSSPLSELKPRRGNFPYFQTTNSFIPVTGSIKDKEKRNCSEFNHNSGKIYDENLGDFPVFESSKSSKKSMENRGDQEMLSDGKEYFSSISEESTFDLGVPTKLGDTKMKMFEDSNTLDVSSPIFSPSQEGRTQRDSLKNLSISTDKDDIHEFQENDKSRPFFRDNEQNLMGKSSEKIEMENEAAILSLLNGHKNIVGFRGSYEGASLESSPRICMELINGVNLQRLKRTNFLFSLSEINKLKHDGQLSTPRALLEARIALMCKDLLEALLAMRRVKFDGKIFHVAHRDIKIDNIMVETTDGVEPKADVEIKRYVLVDFGYAILMEPNERCYFKMGTEDYMAPEVFKLSYCDSFISDDDSISGSEEDSKDDLTCHGSSRNPFLFEEDEIEDPVLKADESFSSKDSSVFFNLRYTSNLCCGNDGLGEEYDGESEDEIDCDEREIENDGSESDSQSGSESDSESDSESNSESDSESNRESDSGSDSESDSQSDGESGSESDGESGSELENDSGNQSDNDSESQSASVSDCKLENDFENKSDQESDSRLVDLDGAGFEKDESEISVANHGSSDKFDSAEKRSVAFDSVLDRLKVQNCDFDGFTKQLDIVENDSVDEMDGLDFFSGKSIQKCCLTEKSASSLDTQKETSDKKMTINIDGISGSEVGHKKYLNNGASQVTKTLLDRREFTRPELDPIKRVKSTDNLGEENFSSSLEQLKIIPRSAESISRKSNSEKSAVKLNDEDISSYGCECDIWGLGMIALALQNQKLLKEKKILQTERSFNIEQYLSYVAEWSINRDSSSVRRWLPDQVFIENIVSWCQLDSRVSEENKLPQKGLSIYQGYMLNFLDPSLSLENSENVPSEQMMIFLTRTLAPAKTRATPEELLALELFTVNPVLDHLLAEREHTNP